MCRGETHLFDPGDYISPESARIGQVLLPNGQPQTQAAVKPTFRPYAIQIESTEISPKQATTKLELGTSAMYPS